MLYRSRQSNIEGKVCLFEKTNKFHSYSHFCAHTLILTSINQELYISKWMHSGIQMWVPRWSGWGSLAGCHIWSPPHISWGFLLGWWQWPGCIPTSPNVSTAVLYTLMQNSTGFLLQSLQQGLYKSELLVNKYSPFSLIWLWKWLCSDTKIKFPSHEKDPSYNG